jgi:hypothetical protein
MRKRAIAGLAGIALTILILVSVLTLQGQHAVLSPESAPLPTHSTYQDLVGDLERIQYPYPYLLGAFDCSQMAAYTADQLVAAGWDRSGITIAQGTLSWASGGLRFTIYHSWLLVKVSNVNEEILVEATPIDAAQAGGHPRLLSSSEELNYQYISQRRFEGFVPLDPEYDYTSTTALHRIEVAQAVV